MQARDGVTGRHFRTMKKWGYLGVAPYYDKRAKRSEVRLWQEGIEVFEKWQNIKEKYPKD